MSGFITPVEALLLSRLERMALKYADYWERLKVTHAKGHLSVVRFEPEVRALAGEARMGKRFRVEKLHKVRQQHVLPTFFSRGSIRLLHATPNQYWFWCVVAELARCGGDRLRFSLRQVRPLVNESRRRFRATQRLPETTRSICLAGAAG